LGRAVRDDAIDTDEREAHGEQGEYRQQRHVEAAIGQ
jgi:hypothetical protein